MSQTKGKDSSDDEFQDALNISPRSMGSKHETNETAIDELIQKQSDMNILEEEEENFQDANQEEGAVGGEATNETNKDAQTDSASDIDEEELREREKTMTDEELKRNKEEANKMKLEGNELFQSDNSEDAIVVYTEALKICPTTCTKERAILYGNRAAAKIKLNAKKPAIDDCSKAIELYPEYVRALLRRAKLYENEDKLDEALADYKRVYDLDPGQPDAREAVVRLPPIINERNERMKEEMMSKLKDLGNMFLKPFGLSTNNFQMQQDPKTGSYSVNFNQK